MVGIKSLFDDLNLEKLRINRPSKFVFLCGGVISKSPGAKPGNLRDYLCRVRPLKLSHPIILAEGAVEDQSGVELGSGETPVQHGGDVIGVVEGSRACYRAEQGGAVHSGRVEGA